MKDLIPAIGKYRLILNIFFYNINIMIKYIIIFFILIFLVLIFNNSFEKFNENENNYDNSIVDLFESNLNNIDINTNLPDYINKVMLQINVIIFNIVNILNSNQVDDIRKAKIINTFILKGYNKIKNTLDKKTILNHFNLKLIIPSLTLINNNLNSIYSNKMNKYTILIFMLLDLRYRILNDNFLKHLNCSYLTLLNNSFENKDKFFTNYINSLNIDLDFKEILLNYFNEGNLEIDILLYKQFIISLKGNCSLQTEGEKLIFYDNLKKKKIGGTYCNYIVDKELCNTMNCYYDETQQKCSQKTINSNCMQHKDVEICNNDNDLGCLYNETRDQCEHKVCDGIGEIECNKISNCNYDKNLHYCKDNLRKDLEYNSCNILTKANCNSRDDCIYLDKNTLENPSSFESCININDFSNKNIKKEYQQKKCNNITDKGNCNSDENCFYLENETDGQCLYKDYSIIQDVNCQGKDENNCKNSLNCFWKNDKCFKNDGINDGSTKCSNFTYLGQEYCPMMNCKWENSNCVSKYPKYHSPDYVGVTEEKKEEEEAIDPNFKINIDRVNCDSINYKRENQLDKMLECVYYNHCNYNVDNDLCKKGINNNCIYKSKNDCLSDNYNINSDTNKCRWINNKNMVDKGICVELREEVPCYGYDEESCPIEDKYNTFGNIVNKAKCKLNNSKCERIKKCNEYGKDDCPERCILENNECKKDEDLCKFSLKNDIICRGINIKNKNIEKNISVNRKHLPCSKLNKDECYNNLEVCDYDNLDQKCKVKKSNALTTFLEKRFKNTDFINFDNVSKKMNNIFNLNNLIN